MLCHGETVYRLRAGLANNPYSGKTDQPDWDNCSRLAIDGCAIWPSETNEHVDVGREQLYERLNVALPCGADVTDRDRLEIRGIVYDVTGAPHDWHNPLTGENPGTTLQASRRLG